MPFIEWKAEFSVGIVRFDDDHRHLISLMNQLHSAMEDDQGKLALSSILEGLIWYTQSHFSAEEALMQRYAYPDFSLHKAEHERFANRVVHFAEGFKAGREVLATDVAAALKEWLTNHILRCDAAYTSFFQSHGVADDVIASDNVSRSNASDRNVRSHSERLQRSEHLGRKLSELLELIARSGALEPVLRKLMVLVKKHCGRDAAILLKTNGRLELIAASGNIPAGICSELSDLVSSNIGFACGGNIEFPEDTAVKGCAAIVAIHESGGKLLGCVLLLGASAAIPSEWELLRRAARVASIAVQHRQIEDQIMFAAQHDPATELPNRLLLTERIEEALLRANREQVSVAVLVIQLNRFQEIAESYGHAAGDSLLRLVAQRLSKCVSFPHTVARLSGGTFAVLWSGVLDRTAAENIARSVLKSFKRAFSLAGNTRRMTAAIGVVIYPQDGSTSGDLIRNATAAMKQGGTLGRNTFQLFVPKTALLLEERLAVEKHLETAQERGELHLVYQPQVDLTGRVVGFEALLRWQNPILGNVSPAVFIPIAEENGLISSIDAWVLHHACLQAAHWHSCGAKVRMAINISGAQFTSAELVEKVKAALRETCVEPSLIELEVTETAVMQNLHEAASQIERLRSLGVRIAIDDFGVGYSSLSYLRLLPVDRVKIDRSFLDDIESSTNSAAILKAVIQLSHKLGLETILEGVETEAELEIVAPLRPDLIQGYLFHRPMSSSEAEGLMPELARVSVNDRHLTSIYELPCCPSRQVTE